MLNAPISNYQDYLNVINAIKVQQAIFQDIQEKDVCPKCGGTLEFYEDNTCNDEMEVYSTDRCIDCGYIL